MDNYTISARHQMLVNQDVSGLDIIHGELKNWMYENEQLELEATDEYLKEYLKGYGDALQEVYKLTYQLSFAIGDKNALI
jgi:hypothetical protein